MLDVKNSVEIVEDTVKNALHQVSWPDLRCELFDVSHPVEYLTWAGSEAEYRERREGFDVVVSYLVVVEEDHGGSSHPGLCSRT